MLKLERLAFYKVKKGQTLGEIADAFCVSERLLAKVNCLTEAPLEGCVLRIPEERGNIYYVCQGDTPSLLCGSEERFAQKNGDKNLYLGRRVVL